MVLAFVISNRTGFAEFLPHFALAAIMSPLLPAAQFVRQIFKHPAGMACVLSVSRLLFVVRSPKFKCCFSR